MLYNINIILQLITIFAAVLGGAIAIRLVFITRGGIASKAIQYLGYGLGFILIAFLLFFAGMAADALHPFSTHWTILATNAFFTIGFILVLISEYILFKELS